MVQVTKSSCPDDFCGKLIATEKMPEFLSLEGNVLKVLRAHPHPNILMPVAIVNAAPVSPSPSPSSSAPAPPATTASAVIYPAVGEDLHSYVRTHKGLPEREAKSIFRSILSAVAHCHTHRIVLRDLRLGKIFFKKGSRTEVVIGDLDGAQVVSHAAPFLSDRKGSPAFVSPEVLVSQAFDGAAADMWALGVMLFILLTGTYPFQDTQLATLFQKIQQGHAAVHFPSGMSEAARDIIRSLLVREPHLRLTAAQVQADLWLVDLPPPAPREEWYAEGLLGGGAGSGAFGGMGAVAAAAMAAMAAVGGSGLPAGVRRRRRSSSDYTISVAKRTRGEFDDVDEEQQQQQSGEGENDVVLAHARDDGVAV